MNEFVDAHCWQVHEAAPQDDVLELHRNYVALVEPLLAQHLRGARITDAEFERIVAHTRDNPELTDVIPDHVTALRDVGTFEKVTGRARAAYGTLPAAADGAAAHAGPRRPHPCLRRASPHR